MNQFGGVRLQDTIIIFPGRFQPFHKGHNDVYRYLKEIFPNVFITTTNTNPKKESEKVRYPFNFEEKVDIMTKLVGVDVIDIVPEPTRYPYSDAETLSYIKRMKNSEDPSIQRKFEDIDLNVAIIVFVISSKDKDRFDFPKEGLSLKKRNQTPAKIQRLRFLENINNNNNYIPRFNNIDITQIHKSYNYVMTMPTFSFKILGSILKGATQFREMMGSPPEGFSPEDVVEDLYSISGDNNRIKQELLEKVKERLIR